MLDKLISEAERRNKAGEQEQPALKVRFPIHPSLGSAAWPDRRGPSLASCRGSTSPQGQKGYRQGHLPLSLTCNRLGEQGSCMQARQPDWLPVLQLRIQTAKV